MEKLFHRVRPWLAGAATLVVTLLPQVALADDQIRTIVDGRLLTFDVAPVVQNDRTLVPMRGLLTALGASVNWDDATRTASASLGETEIKTVLGSKVATVNGKEVALEIPVQVIENRTMIPLRFFVENLGLAVTWDGESRIIYVDSRRGSVASRDGSTVSRTRTAMVEAARLQVGAAYSWGGTSPATGFDCSGFVTYLSGQFNLGLPRTSFEMFAVGLPVEQKDLQAGDLVFFTTYAPGASHVGVYDGNGSFIHAQSSETGVRVTPLAKEWWAERYIGARRVIR